MLGHSRYWTRQFVDVLMRHCDHVGRFRPDEAARFAEHLPALVARVRLDDSPEAYPNETAQRSALAMAHVLRDHYARRVGCLDFADEDEEALEALLQQGLHGNVLAERLKRRALPTFQGGDPARAVRMLNQAIEIAGLNHPRILREAVLLRGMLCQQALNKSALRDLGAALLLVKPVGLRGSDLLLEVALAMDYDLLRFTPDADVLASAGHLLKAARKRWARCPRCRAKAWLYWLSGSVLRRMGIDRHAHRLLLKAADLLDGLGRPFERSMVRLDLALTASTFGDPDAMRRHAAHGRETLKSLEISADLAKRLEPLLDRKDEETLQTVRRICWPKFAETVRA
ncbi:MAG: hypothetical protein AAGC60_17710 [Acidobacteriota bacterium]